MKDRFGLINMQNQMLIESAKQEVRACNAMSEKFGLSLNEDEIRELVECRADALKKQGELSLQEVFYQNSYMHFVIRLIFNKKIMNVR